MFGTLSEKLIRVIRWTLVLGWLVLIVSLFYDPVTPTLNDPSATWSPFRINPEAAHGAGREAMDWACPNRVEGADGAQTIDWHGYPEGQCDPRCTRVQGACVIEQPYAMGARVFWTMGLPLLPFAFLLFGHEFWRRICPLSALMQIPRSLGIQRIRRSLNLKTGRVEKNLALVHAESFLGKYFWFVQFGLLCAGVSLRLVAINSDRVALGLFFLSVIAIAMTIGYLFGGKTWCQYICPLSPVQKIYTEPRGLLESTPHLSNSRLTQSMCRRITPSGEEVSNCVGCISPCPDINLERQYWTRIEQPGRRFAHFGYIGMIWGFYGYYALYAGNWQYYFSGAWTHEETQLATMLAPGFYLWDTPIGIPRLLAAPLTIAAAVFLAYGIGRLLEALWVAVRTRAGRPPSSEERAHKPQILAAVLAFNSFYLFGGRPNINLLPDAGQTLVDITILTVSVLWAARNWPRTSELYHRESIAGGLRRQLATLNLDIQRLLNGKSVDQLSVDEVHTLARALPTLAVDQRREAYKATLRDALNRGYAQTGTGAEMLQQLREQMEITEDDHRLALAELGIEDDSLVDAENVIENESRWRLEGYRDSIASLLERAIEQGRPVRQVLAEPETRDAIAKLQTLYRISDDEHERVLGDFAGSNSRLIRGANDRVTRLRWLQSLSQALRGLADPAWSGVAQLLVREVQREQRAEHERILSFLYALGNDPQAHQIARAAASADPPGVLERLEDWHTSQGGEQRWRHALHPTIVSILDAQAAEQNAPVAPLDLSHADGIETLDTIVRAWRPTASAAALTLLHGLDPERALALARAQLASTNTPNWLVTETAAALLDARSPLDRTIGLLARLLRTELFRDTDNDALARLARTAEVRRLRSGDYVCHEGDADREVFCLTAGLADVVLNTPQGMRRVAQIHPGESAGELSVLTGQPRTASVVAATDDTEIVVIDGRAFDRFLERDARSVLQIVSRRLSNTLRTQPAAPSAPAADLPIAPLRAPEPA